MITNESPANQEGSIIESAKSGRLTREFYELSSRSKRRLIGNMPFDPKTESFEKVLFVAQRTGFKRDFDLVILISVITKRGHKSPLLYAQLATLEEKMTSFAYFLDNKLSKSVNILIKKHCEGFHRTIAKIKNECSPLKTSKFSTKSQSLVA